MGVAGSILDGKLVVEAPEAILAAGRQARVPVIIGANDWDLGIGSTSSKDELFARLARMPTRLASYTTRAETRRSTS